MKEFFLKQKENLKVVIPAIYLALKDKRTSKLAKLMAILTVAYFLSPIDLIPDFIPVFGYLDDLLILPILAGLTIKLIDKEVYQQCLKESANLWENGKPKKWYYALPIVFVWIFVVIIVLKFFK